MLSPRIYTYKVTFDEIPDWYWGVHKEKTYGECYLGSPVTHKWKWEFYTPVVQILETFDYTPEGWEEAKTVEHRLITPDLNNPLCLNEANGAQFSLEVLKKAGEVGGRTTTNRGYLKYGSPNSIKTFDTLSNAGKIGGARTRDSGKLKEASRLGGLVQGPRNKGMKWYYCYSDTGELVLKKSKTPLSDPWKPGRG